MIDKLMQGMKEIGWDLEQIRYMDKEAFISLIGYHNWILEMLYMKVCEGGEEHGLLTSNEVDSLGFIKDLLKVLKEDNNA